MTFFKKLFLISFIFSTTLQAGVEQSEDVLATVSQKLIRIENHLKDQRVFVSSAHFEWKELNEFRDELMFVVAHDPTGPVAKDTPSELIPSHLTQRLKLALAKLEGSIFQIGRLAHQEEWTLLKTEMDKFIALREQFLYVPARVMIRTGALTGQLDKLQETATIILKGDQAEKNISVRVIDPAIEGLTKELNYLNHSVRQLQEFNKPRPVEVKTVFQKKNYAELFTFGGVALLVGFLATICFQWLIGKFSKAVPVQMPKSIPLAFDYYDWLKGLETNLKAFKSNEEKNTEDQITLKNLSHELHEARKGLNLAENHQDYYVSLEQLNLAAPKLEEYFEKMNIKKNAEVSRRMIKMVVQLCDAIESRHEITFNDYKGKLKVSKLDSQVSDLNAA